MVNIHNICFIYSEYPKGYRRSTVLCFFLKKSELGNSFHRLDYNNPIASGPLYLSLKSIRDIM